MGLHWLASADPSTSGGYPFFACASGEPIGLHEILDLVRFGSAVQFHVASIGKCSRSGLRFGKEMEGWSLLRSLLQAGALPISQSATPGPGPLPMME
jgi:hypothetical protein